ncbi:uncharacterized protein C13orf42 homolog [Centrocercus urophasianus]|uniref:uncharacterized protein C13orf42 homolog n=1 Tax=Centrocercus urophasianus TaxID=9002 RepID=UPI001C650B3A|nr:uncharacterized protein C13orf42 homolog [Centrocercus urophasianus]
MFKKIHSIFHPNSHRRNATDDIPYWDGTGSAVRLIRSTSMYVLGDEQEKVSEPLKKCKSTNSIDSCSQSKEEDREWMYSKTQDCLKYLQDLALRKKYFDNINKLKSMHMTADSPTSTKSSKTGKKSFLPLSSKEFSKTSMERRKVPQPSSDVREAIAFFDSVIADLDSERCRRAPDMDLPNVDVDFDVATSTSEHSLHSNWILRAPRRYSEDTAQTAKAANQSQKNSQRSTTGSRKRLERHPMYLPKAVEGAYNTLKFKPKTRKKEY